MDNIELNVRFTYHPPPDDETRDKYMELRERARDLAFMIATLTPESREQSLAITKLEESVMWANAAIARQPAREVVKT